MPRQKSVQLAYQFHVSGQARVALCGKDFDLGVHDTDESCVRYYALREEYNANGRQLESDSLSVLASQINEQHAQASRHATSALEHARQAGEQLQRIGTSGTAVSEGREQLASDHQKRRRAVFDDWRRAIDLPTC